MNLLDFDYLFSVGRDIRLHGNRFIQIDLEGKMERVHLWSDILPVAQKRASPWHDHTFGFESEILAGTLINIFYVLYAGSDFRPWRAVPREGANTLLVKAERTCNLTPTGADVYTKGHHYTVPVGVVHTTSYVGFAVTHMTKLSGPRFTEAGPFVYCPAAYLPDNTYGRYMYSQAHLWELVREILKQV